MIDDISIELQAKDVDANRLRAWRIGVAYYVIAASPDAEPLLRVTGLSEPQKPPD